MVVNKYFILFLIVSVNVFGQRQFQINFGNGYSVDDVFNLEHSPTQTKILFSIGGCFDPQFIPSCESVGFLTLNNNNSISTCFQFHSPQYDTSYSLTFFKSLNRGDVCAIGTSYNGTSLLDLPTYLLLDSNSNVKSAASFRFTGMGNFNRIRTNSTESAIFMSGQIDSLYQPTSLAAILVKFDSSFSPIWSKIYSGQYSARFFDFDISSTGNIYACGSIADSFPFTGHILLNKLDIDGNIIWSKKYKANRLSSTARNIKLLSDGIILNGTCWDSVYQSAGPYIMKLDTLGNILWIRKYICHAVSDNGFIQTTDAGFLMSSRFPYNGVPAACLIKTDSIGNWQWSYFYEKGEYNIYHEEDGQGGYYSIGKSWRPSFPGPNKPYIHYLKTDTLGLSGCYELDLPVLVSSDNNLTVSATNLVSNNYFPDYYSFFIQKDTFSISPSIICDGITNIENSFDVVLSVYPNPALNYLKFILESEIEAKAEITIFDVTGKEFLNPDLKILRNKSETELNISHLPQGIYFIKIEMRNQIYHSRFVKL